MLWMSRGFFSALIHLVCVVVAGAVAFAVWEPLAYAILSNAGDSKFLQGSAWAIALGLPFAAVVAVLRVGLDALLPSNVAVHTAANYAGGFVCGAGAGVISAGILVLSLGFLRLDHDLLGSDSFGGYKPAVYEGNGSVVRGEGLWIPADKLTAEFYGLLSRTTLRTENNLASLYPDLDAVGATLRMNHGMGKGRNTTRPGDFSVVTRYTVGEDGKLSAEQLLSDRWNAGSQRAQMFDKSGVPAGSHLEGFVVKFNSSAKEFGGDAKVTVGNGQVRLVVQNGQDEEDVRTVFPVAVVAQADPSTPGVARFRYDAKETFLAAVGGASEALMAFEFVVPPGYVPTALYVKNVRHVVGEGPTATVSAAQKFASAEARDGAVQAIAMGAASVGNLDTSSATTIKTGGQAPPGSFGPAEGIMITSQLPFVMSKAVIRELSFDSGNMITDGEQVFSSDDKKNYPTDKDLRMNGFAATPDTVIVQIDVTLGQKASWLGNAAAAAEDLLPPQLVDTNGQAYQPIGYVYENGQDGTTRVRFTPGNPIRALKEVPTLSRSRPNDKLKLIFRPSAGVSVKSFGVGNKVILTWNPPVKLTTPGR